MENKIERIKQLTDILSNASNAYYNSSKLLMTDKEWDARFDELKRLETETGIIMTSSPTQKVGAEVKTNLEKVTHTTKMLSLAKTKDVNELIKFLGTNEGILSWKEDGLTVVLSYDNGVLIDAVTRGNGEIGSRILENAKVFQAGIPLQISYTGHLIVRGEGLISKDNFSVLNVDSIYSNPRNLTSGSIMALDNQITKNRFLQFKAFSIAECDRTFSLYSEQLDWLKEIGFDPVEYICVNKDQLAENIETFKKHIDNYIFMTDGLVLKFNDLKYGANLGATSHHRLDSLAFKWSDTAVETTIKNIYFQVGRTGVLTPVVNFDEVQIEGTMVSKATMHNISILKSFEMGIGDTITVYKANMIIPQVDDNLTRSGSFKLPTVCPACGEKVVSKYTDNAEFLMCTNPNCSARQIQKFVHYCNRDAMNIMGISEATIEILINAKLLQKIEDLYNISMHKDTIVALPGLGKQSYTNIVNSIDNSKECTLESFIYSLGFDNTGKGTAKRISQSFNGSIDKFEQAIQSHYDFSNIKDIGTITNSSIHEWFVDNTNMTTYKALLDILHFKTIEVAPINISVDTDNKLYGKHIYPTGKFALKKADLYRKLLSVGCIIESGYKKSLDYLICGNDTSKSGKVAKAITDNVELMSEEEMMKLLK